MNKVNLILMKSQIKSLEAKAKTIANLIIASLEEECLTDEEASTLWDAYEEALRMQWDLEDELKEYALYLKLKGKYEGEEEQDDDDDESCEEDESLHAKCMDLYAKCMELYKHLI